MAVPLASSASASRSLRMICSGEWRIRFIESPPALVGENDSHIGWTSPGGAGQATHAILEILPEVDSQPSARLLQARERVPRTSSRLTAGAAADLPLLHVVPDVPLAQVVVQRHPRPLQHPQL